MSIESGRPHLLRKFLSRTITTTIPDIRPDAAPDWQTVHAALLAFGLTSITPHEIATWRGVSRERGRQLLHKMEQAGMARRVQGRPGERRLLDGSEMAAEL